MRLNRLNIGLVALITATPTFVFAHPEHGHIASFTTGFMHPMSGLDHLLAMLAIGLWAASLGGRALWAVPMAFVGTMIVGGTLGAMGLRVPFVEQGIAISVILMGALLVGSARFPVAVCVGIAGLFALFHGVAHGMEMPLNTNGAEYALGFAVATALLHVVGIALGVAIERLQVPIITRITGSMIAIAGLFMVII